MSTLPRTGRFLGLALLALAVVIGLSIRRYLFIADPLAKYDLHKDKELFDKAYGYIKEYY